MLQDAWIHFVGLCRSFLNVPPDNIDDKILEYAFREFQTYHANFDALDAKASGIIQFVAIVLGLSAFQARFDNTTPLRLAALIAFAAALFFSLFAWWVRGGQGIPKVDNVQNRLGDIGHNATHKELIQCLAESSDSARKLCLKKTELLKWAFLFVSIGVILLLCSMIIR